MALRAIGPGERDDRSEGRLDLRFDEARELLRPFLHDPANRDAIRDLLLDDILAPPARCAADDLDLDSWVAESEPFGEAALLGRLARAVSQGRVSLWEADAGRIVETTSRGAGAAVGDAPLTTAFIGQNPGREEDKASPAGKKEKQTGKTDRKRHLVLNCSHSIDGAPRVVEDAQVFEIVPGHTEETRVTTIATPLEDTVSILYRDDDRPPPESITVNGTPVKDTGTEGRGYRKYPLTVAYRGPDTIDILSSEFWKSLSSTTDYRVSGIPVPLTIKAHYPHHWKLKIIFPPMRSFSAGSKYDVGARLVQEGDRDTLQITQSGRSVVEKSGWKPLSLRATTTEAAVTGRIQSDISVSPDSVSATGEARFSASKPKTSETPAPVKTIEVLRDDAQVNINVLDFFSTILDFTNKLMEIVDQIKDVAPKVGWYCDFDLQLFQGLIELDWAWREYKDHRAYQWIAAQLACEVIKISFELGVGISGFSFKAQLYGNISGSLGVSLSGERVSPEALKFLLVPLNVDIPGALGLRIEAAYLLEFVGELQSGFEIQLALSIDMDKGWQIQGHTTWKGVRVKVRGGIGKGGKHGSREIADVRLADEHKSEFKVPGRKEYKAPYIPDDQLRAVLKTVLEKNWGVTVKKKVDFWFDKNWTVDQIIDPLITRINRRRNLRRDQKTMEGLAHEIRKELDRLGERWGPDYVDESRYELFVEGGELDRILDHYVDPCQVIQAQLTG